MHKPKTLHEQQPQFKIELVGWMVRICHSLELTQTQRQRIETCYHAVGNWLAEGTHYLLKGQPSTHKAVSGSVPPLSR